VLRSLDDHELEQCMRNQFVEMGSVAFFLIMIPVALATISTMYITNLMDMVIYTTLNVFLIVTYVIYVVSVPGIIIFSAIFGGVTVYYYGVFAGAVRRASRMGTYVDAFGHVKTRRHPASSDGFHHRRQSLVRDVSHSAFYVIVALFDLFAYVHVLSSFAERRRLMAIREADITNGWRMMNSLLAGQTVLSVFELQAEKDDESATDLRGRKLSYDTLSHVGGLNRSASLLATETQKLIKQRSQIVTAEKSFPAEILAMQPTGTKVEDDHDQGGDDRRLLENLFGVAPEGHWGASKGDRVLVNGQPATVTLVNSDKTLDVVMDEGLKPHYRVKPASVQPLHSNFASASDPIAGAGADGSASTATATATATAPMLPVIPVVVKHGAADTYAKLYREKTESTADVHVILKRMLVRAHPCPSCGGGVGASHSRLRGLFSCYVCRCGRCLAPRRTTAAPCCSPQWTTLGPATCTCVWRTQCSCWSGRGRATSPAARPLPPRKSPR